MKNKKDKERQENLPLNKKTAKNDRIKNKIFHEEQS